MAPLKPLLLTLSLTACSPYAEFGIQEQLRDGGLTGNGPVGIFRIRQDFNRLVWCEYQHVSFITEGVPFNDDPEDTLDALGCGVRLQLWK